MTFQARVNADPVIKKSVTIDHQGPWIIRIFGKAVSQLFHIRYVNTSEPHELLKTVDSMNVCVGHYKEKYHALVDSNGNVGSGKFCSTDIVQCEGQFYNGTIRSHTCELLIPTSKTRCDSCTKYGDALRSKYSRYEKSKGIDRTAIGSHVPMKFLRPKELTKRSHGLAKAITQRNQRIRRLQNQLKTAIKDDAQYLNEELSGSLQEVVRESVQECPDTLKKGSFEYLFWEEQKKEWRTKDPRGHRWHPMMVKWALNLRYSSPKGYRNLQSSGVLKLPGLTTLRDYTYWSKVESGFSETAIEYVMDEMNWPQREPHQKYVTLLHDEMKIQSDLVYDKTTGNLVGFVDLGETNNRLRAYEQALNKNEAPEHSIAKQMLVFMIRGLFYNFTYPIASFPTTNTLADEIFSLTWEAIEHLETAGFKVAAVTCDGAATNRCFFDLNADQEGLVYKTKNVCAMEEEPRQIYFITDPPHLIKCVRNAFASSFAHNKTRILWVSVYVLP